MNPVRERRLVSDHDAVHAFVEAAAGRVLLEGVQGSPADTYHLVFRCRCVTEMHGGEAVLGQSHRLRVYLPAQYPAAPPVAALTSAVLHPHVWPNGTVCLGPWNPSEKLDSVLARIGAILTYDPAALNWRSVANESAVPWAQANRDLLPLDKPYALPVAALAMRL